MKMYHWIIVSHSDWSSVWATDRLHLQGDAAGKITLSISYILFYYYQSAILLKMMPKTISSGSGLLACTEKNPQRHQGKYVWLWIHSCFILSFICAKGSCLYPFHLWSCSWWLLRCTEQIQSACQRNLDCTLPGFWSSPWVQPKITEWVKVFVLPLSVLMFVLTSCLQGANILLNDHGEVKLGRWMSECLPVVKMSHGLQSDGSNTSLLSRWVFRTKLGLCGLSLF